MVDPKLIDGWIEKADEDLEYAKISLKEGLEFYPQICFLLHQAVEKYLKAYIIASELDFQKTHDLGRLVKICGQKDHEFDQFFDKITDLNTYYIETRYPDFEIIVNKSQAEIALNLVEQIAAFVKQKLEGEVVKEEPKKKEE